MFALHRLRAKVADYFSPRARKLRRFNQQHQLDKYLVSSLNKRRTPTIKQLKYITHLLTGSEKKWLAFWSVIAIACMTIVGVSGYRSATEVIARAGGEYSEGLIGAPRYINPILAQTNDVDLDLSRLIFSGLMKLDHDNRPMVDLAERYEISEDQLTYTFYLRQNAKWHDGQPVRADDVIFTIASIQDQEFNSPLIRSFRGVVAEKLDDQTIKFTLKEPFAPFLNLLTVGILPEHLWYNVPAANANLNELNKKPIGSGPWQFTSFKKDGAGLIKSYALTPYDEYYGQKPYLDQLTFRFYSDSASAVEALRNKQVKAISYLPVDQIGDVRNLRTIEIKQLNQARYVGLFFNQSKNEFLRSSYLRQALALATDKKKLTSEALGGLAKVIETIDLPGIATTDQVKTYQYDPQAAAQLLEDNGWKLVTTTTKDGITEQVREKKGAQLTFNMTIVDQPSNLKLAELISQSWGQIGVKVNIVVIDRSRVSADVLNNRNYDILLFGQNIGSDPDPFAFWHSSQSVPPGLNLAGFNNKKSDELLEEGRKVSDWQTRSTAYQQFAKILADELPAIFLYTPAYLYPQDRDVKGFDLTSIATPSDRLSTINDWYTRTKRVWK